MLKITDPRVLLCQALAVLQPAALFGNEDLKLVNARECHGWSVR